MIAPTPLLWHVVSLTCVALTTAAVLWTMKSKRGEAQAESRETTGAGLSQTERFDFVLKNAPGDKKVEIDRALAMFYVQVNAILRENQRPAVDLAARPAESSPIAATQCVEEVVGSPTIVVIMESLSLLESPSPLESRSPLVFPLPLECPPSPTSPSPLKSPSSPPPLPIVAASLSAQLVDNDDDSIIRFKQMLKMGVPEGAVRNKMLSEGMDPGLLFAVTAPLASQTPPPFITSGSSDKLLPLPGRFQTMLKVGVPLLAVEAKMKAEDIDTSLYDAFAGPCLKPSTPMKILGESNQLKSLSTPGKLIVGLKKPTMIINMESISQDKIGPETLWGKEMTIWSDKQDDLLKRAKAVEVLFRPHQDQDKENSAPSSSTFKRSTSPAPRKKLQASSQQTPGSSAKHSRQSLFPARRVQNVQIAFARMRITIPKICDAIKGLDTDVFTSGGRGEDNLQVLLNLVPSDDELKTIQGVVLDDACGDVEKLFHAFAQKVPDAKNRVEAMIFLMRFPPLSSDLKNRVDKMRALCGQVLGNELLIELLHVVVLVGNAINGTNETSVSIHDLGNRLHKTKTVDGTMTAADLVASLFSKRNEMREFRTALTQLSHTAAMQIGTIKKESEDLVKEAKRALKVATAQPALGITTEYVQNAETTRDGAIALEQEYRNVLLFFGEPVDRPSSIFFKDMNSLIDSTLNGKQVQV